MKADMEAMKEQMATMMEAMMSIKKIMEANAVAVADTNVVAKVNPMPPSGLNQMNHPTSDMVGRDLGSMDGPMMCKFKTSTPSRHMACLPTILHPMWRTLPVRMLITPLPYSLRANNLNPPFVNGCNSFQIPSNSLQTQTPIPIQSQILAGCNPRHSTNPISSQIHARQVPPLRCSQASPHTARNLAHNSEAEDTTIHRLCRSGFRRR